MNDAQITLIGFVATDPRFLTTRTGTPSLTMRVGMTPRRIDRESGEWSDGDTTYVTVNCWRGLASNAAACLRKGEPVVVKGRLRVRTYTDKEGSRRIVVEIDAATIGHDLTRGVAHFQRTRAVVNSSTTGAVKNGSSFGSPDGEPGDQWTVAGHQGAEPVDASVNAVANLFDPVALKSAMDDEIADTEECEDETEGDGERGEDETDGDGEHKDGHAASTVSTDGDVLIGTDSDEVEVLAGTRAT